MLALLFLALGSIAAAYIFIWGRDIRRRSARVRTTPGLGVLGCVTNFFDALGIGSFATTTSAFKFWRLVDDRVIPGTLNVGHTLPTVAQAFIFIAVVKVDVRTLVLLIAAAVAGAWLGAGVVARWPRRSVQLGMGGALLAAAALMLGSLLKIGPPGGEALALTGTRLWLGITGNFLLGALMTLGIGLYAPCLIMISMLGMSPLTAFPIMMGSCAFLMPVGSARFIREGSYDPRAALGLAIGGVPGVLVAGLIVKSLPLDLVRWLVVVVVIYTAIAMLRSAMRERVAAPVAVPAAD
ncbi:MAG TPA: sulfite exporter TauE/SafE family protein [Longimicrobiales bacterium]|nr:sulfite exporter TauE/SafE family protein [Longimicrobiales bacterium]